MAASASRRSDADASPRKRREGGEDCGRAEDGKGNDGGTDVIVEGMVDDAGTDMKRFQYTETCFNTVARATELLRSTESY